MRSWPIFVFDRLWQCVVDSYSGDHYNRTLEPKADENKWS